MSEHIYSEHDPRLPYTAPVIVDLESSENTEGGKPLTGAEGSPFGPS